MINEVLNLFNDSIMDKLNSLTKYPSILTYHEMGDRGRLKSNLSEPCWDNNTELYVTEKIDGTNSRIIYHDGDYIIGSREELLYARNDRFGNPALGIKDIVKPIADTICLFGEKLSQENIYIFYMESYGGKITKGSKNYTSNGSTNARLFDVAIIPVATVKQMLDECSIEEIVSWREHSTDRWQDVETIKRYSSDVLFIDTVPYLKTVNSSSIPTDTKETFEWLKEYSDSIVALDPKALHKSEGVVIRTKDRKLIKKLRFEDYTRTFK